jgi:hypothetical protein
MVAAEQEGEDMRARLYSNTLGALLVVQLCWAGTAAAQLPIPASTQFDITGLLQEATVTTPGDAHSGGSLTVNGIVVTVPRETIVILPANALTWEELFAQAPAPYGLTATPPSTGLALADLPQPLTTYEVQVVGNRVLGATDQYIAGLIYVSKEFLNSGAGFVNFIDYTLGEMRVGGIIAPDGSSPGCAQGGTFATNPTCTGARVRINDPVNVAVGTGRFSAGQSPDVRFTVDQDNPTIMSGTAYPMCLPRVAPPAVDPLCPEGNRPRDLAGNPVPTVNMPDPSLLAAGQLPDPRIQAPFEVGDYVTYSGTLVSDLATPTVGPYGPPGLGTAGTYTSAHTIINNVAIYTFPGTNPAYIETEVFILGTGGLTVIGVGEAAIRSRFEGMTTDPSRSVHLYGIDLDPVTGAGTDRDWGIIGVDQGPPLGAVKGRWRFRPPCAPFGTDPATIKFDKQCIMNAANTFLPAPREMRAVIEGLQTQIPGTAGAVTSANGIVYGQYHAPILEYIFPENIPGTPIVENNFNTMPFLACGGYTSSAGTLAGQLSPWPSNVVPVCANTAPVANAGPDQTVASGALVTLAGSATGTTPMTFAWLQTAGPAVTLSNAAIAGPSFTAPSVAVTTVLTFQLTATNALGSSSATVTITVNAAGAPTVNHIAPVTVTSGTPVTMTATGTDPGGLPLTFVWTQTGGTPVVLTPNPFTGAAISFTVTLPVGTLTPTTLQFQVVATNSAGVSSAPEFTTATINPVVDTLVITSAVYRTGKQRLDITVTSSVVSPALNVFLQPYVTTTGTTYDPDPAKGGAGNVFVNGGGGLYTISMVAVPEPAVPPAAPLTVKSSLGGVSAPSPLTRIRQ